MNKKISTCKDLIVWQKTIDLMLEIYKLTESFPKEKIYELTSQIRRSTVAVSSNIAERKLRRSMPSFKQFLLISFGSGGDYSSKRLPQTKGLDYSKADRLE